MNFSVALVLALAAGIAIVVAYRFANKFVSNRRKTPSSRRLNPAPARRPLVSGPGTDDQLIAPGLGPDHLQPGRMGQSGMRDI